MRCSATGENQENVQFLVHVKDSEGSSFSWALERQHEIADFADKSVFCDETHFHLDSFSTCQDIFSPFEPLKYLSVFSKSNRLLV